MFPSTSSSVSGRLYEQGRFPGARCNVLCNDSLLPRFNARHSPEVPPSPIRLPADRCGVMCDRDGGVVLSCRRPVQGYGRSYERLEGILINLIPLMQIDGAPDFAFEARIE